MKTSLSHIQFNIDFANAPFYKDLMQFIGWSEMYSAEGIVGFTNGEKDSVSIWFLKGKSSTIQNHHDMGANHFGIQVEKQSDIDDAVTYLSEKNITPLYSTPRHRPEFAMEQDATYYQVMFESPDNILFELVYTGKKE